MNVARSTFVQRGYLLTALAVAVLLFASSGTAWAQTKVTASSRFSGSSGTLPEGADLADLSEPRPLKVTITRSARSKNDPYNNPPSGTDAHLILQFEHNGARGLPAGITVKADDSTNALPISATGTADLTFASSGKTRSESTTVRITTTDPPTEHPDKVVDNIEVANTQIVLTIEDDRMDDGDWLPETFSMTVSKHSALGRATEFTDDGTAADSTTTTQQRLAATRDPYVNDFTSSKFTVTIADDDPKPKFRFSSRDIQLAKENVQKVTASVGVGPGGASPLPVAEGGTCGGATDSICGRLGDSATAGSGDVLLTVGPPDAVGTLINIRDGDSNVIHPDAMGRYEVGQISTAASAAGIVFEIEAKAVSGFRDEQVTLMLMDGRTAETMEAEGGGIDDADPATVTVLSGEETPTVKFSDDSISIDEGESKSVHLLASTMQGDEVGAVTVAVRGEALISLEQNGSAISGGTVSFGGDANAELTIRAVSDPSLEDGEEKTATVTITDANDADIGDPNTVTVTVVGSTAVPVLPLFGQLLLALLLMVGGARLYRRRQG